MLPKYAFMSRQNYETRTLSIFDFRSCSSSLAHTDIISFYGKHYLNLNLSSCANRRLKIDIAVLKFIIKSLQK